MPNRIDYAAWIILCSAQLCRDPSDTRQGWLGARETYRELAGKLQKRMVANHSIFCTGVTRKVAVKGKLRQPRTIKELLRGF
jgi:hypothetical protein